MRKGREWCSEEMGQQWQKRVGFLMNGCREETGFLRQVILSTESMWSWHPLLKTWYCTDDMVSDWLMILSKKKGILEVSKTSLDQCASTRNVMKKVATGQIFRKREEEVAGIFWIGSECRKWRGNRHKFCFQNLEHQPCNQLSWKQQSQWSSWSSCQNCEEDKEKVQL